MTGWEWVLVIALATAILALLTWAAVEVIRFRRAG